MVLTQQSALRSVHPLYSNEKGDILKKVTSVKHEPEGGIEMPDGLTNISDKQMKRCAVSMSQLSLYSAGQFADNEMSSSMSQTLVTRSANDPTACDPSSTTSTACG